MSETLKDLIERYSKAYKDREEMIGSHLDDQGKPQGLTGDEFEEIQTGHWGDSHGDLGSLLSELADAIGLGLTPGVRVLVKGGAETASGGAVFFDGEVAGEVLDGIDRDGDLKVRADNGIIQYVAPRFVKRLDA